jgi:hypothetical protein
MKEMEVKTKKGQTITVVEEPRFFIRDESGSVDGMPIAGWLTREDAEAHLECWAKEHHYDVA